MCFSAEASFTGGVIISSIGVAALSKVKEPSQLVFASIPLLFGMQQISEGFLWLALQSSDFRGALNVSTYTFLLMARVVWPAWIPLSVLLMEKDAGRRRPLFILLAMGLSVSVYYAYCLLFLNVTPLILGGHIRYESDFPEWPAVPVFIVYFIASITPLFLSSVRRTRVFGALMFISCLVTAVFYFQYLTSVWCFFAALMSGVIYWILADASREAMPAEQSVS